MSERLKAIKEKSKLRRQLLAPIVSINIFIAYVVKTHMNLCDLQKSPTQSRPDQQVFNLFVRLQITQSKKNRKNCASILFQSYPEQ